MEGGAVRDGRERQATRRLGELARTVWRGRIEQVRNLGQVVRILPYGGWLVLGVLSVAQLGSSAMATVMALLSRFLIASVIGVLHARGAAGQVADRRLAIAIAASLGLFVGWRVFSALLAPLNWLYIWRILHRLRDKASRAAVAPAGIAHLETPEVRDVLWGMGWPSAFSPAGAATSFIMLAGMYVGVLGPLAILARFSPPLVFGLLATALVVRWRFAREARQLAPLARAGYQQISRAEYASRLVTSPGPAQEVRLFGLTDWLSERFRTSYLEGRRAFWAEQLRVARFTRWTFLAVGCVYGAVLALLVRAAASGRITIPDLAMYISAAGGILPLLAPMFQSQMLQYGMGDLGANEKVLKKLAAEARVALPRDPVPVPAGPVEVRLESVCFRYPVSERLVLDGLDLVLPAGRSTAVVGANGAGKSTLINLITQMYAPGSGRILANGVDLAHVNPQAWRSKLAVVFQDFARYPLSLAENVGVAAERSSWQDANVVGPLAEAGLADLAASLPKGLQTRLGWSSDDSAELSGGQWQRVCIARALLAVQRGAQLLILDEPTANLDARGELEVFDHIIEACGGTTLLLVSHRFSTVRRAERIVVLRHGKVIEDGSHEELLAGGGRYARMFNLQAAHIRGDTGAGAGTAAVST